MSGDRDPEPGCGMPAAMFALGLAGLAVVLLAHALEHWAFRR